MPDKGCQSGYAGVPPYYYIYWECQVVGTIFTGFTSPNAYADLQGYCTIPFTIFGAWTGSPDFIEADVEALILPGYSAKASQTCYPTSTGGACVSSGGYTPC